MWANRVCLFCFKTFNGSEEESFEKEGIGSLHRFVQFLKNYLRPLDDTIAILAKVASSTLTGRQICRYCGYLVSSMCQLHQELNSVQLKLDWRLKQLNEVLRTPNRASSKLKSVLEKNLATQLESDPQQVHDIRHYILKHCSTGIQKEIRISLGKHSYLDHLRKIKVESANQDKDPNSQSVDLDDFSGHDWHSSGSIVEETNVGTKNEARSELRTNQEFSSGNPVAESKLRPRKRNILPGLPKRPKIEKIAVPKKLLKLSCNICMRPVADTQLKLISHLRMRHEYTWKLRNKGKRPPLQCYFCYQAFVCEQSREIHVELINHGYSLTRGKFACNEGDCTNLELSSMAELNQHFDDIHGSETAYRCSLCGWPFLNDSLREVHELVHMRILGGDYEKNYTCPKCNDKWFPDYESLRVHYVPKHTNLNAKLFKCVECGADFKTNKPYHEHLQQHEMERNLNLGVTTPNDYNVCEECDKTFVSYRSLDAHRRLVHKIVQCSKCGEAVPEIKFSYHMKVLHKEGKPLTCPKPKCSKIFYLPFLLRRHIEEAHNNNKPKQIAKCHICHKEYQRAGLLQSHLKTAHQIQMDSPRNPKFICSECGKEYLTKGSLDQHVDAKHTEESERRWNYKCIICSRSFWRKCLLRDHLAEAHPAAVSASTIE